jgi:hypothetical protein
MDANAGFLDCPAYMDKRGTVRCALPAEVEYVYTMASTDGPLECAKIRCPRGHFFNGPIEALSTENQPESTENQPDMRAPGAPRVRDRGGAARPPQP